MTTTPDLVGQVLHAVWSGSADAFADCFTQDAVIDDCGHLVTGRSAIRAWCATELTGDPCQVTVHDVLATTTGVQVLAAMLSLGFNGPMTLNFTLEHDRVTHLQLRD